MLNINREKLPGSSTDGSVCVDEIHFEQMVNRYHKGLLGYALALVNEPATAEDIVQESLLIAFRRFADFDSSRDFSCWVRGIINLKYLEWKRMRKEIPLDDEMLELLDAQHQTWDAYQVIDGNNVVLAHLRDCVTRLDDVSRRIVREFYFSKQSCGQIARAIVVRESFVRKRLQRARKTLAECLRGKLSYEGRHDG